MFLCQSFSGHFHAAGQRPPHHSGARTRSLTAKSEPDNHADTQQGQANYLPLSEYHPAGPTSGHDCPKISYAALAFGALSIRPITAATRQAIPAMMNAGNHASTPFSAPASLNIPAMIGPTMPPTPYAVNIQP